MTASFPNIADLAWDDVKPAAEGAAADTPVWNPPIETAPPGIFSTGVLRRGVAIR